MNEGIQGARSRRFVGHEHRSLLDVLGYDQTKRLCRDVRNMERAHAAIIAVDKRKNVFLRRGLFEGAFFWFCRRTDPMRSA